MRPRSTSAAARPARRLARRIAVGGAALAALAPLLAVPTAGAAAQTATVAAVQPATAVVLRTREREGGCRGGRGEWELTVHRRPRGRIQVEFSVRRVPRYQKWHLYVANNGHRVASVTRGSGTDGRAKVTRKTRNRRGHDRIRAAAVNPRNGTTCAARLRF